MLTTGRLAVLLLALAFAAACSDSQASPPPPPPTTSAAAGGVAIVPFGAEHAFVDGSRVTMTATRYTLRGKFTEYDGRPVIRLAVSVTNGSAVPVQPQIIVSVTSGGQPAELRTFGGEPVVEASGTLLPGQTQRYDQLVSVTDPGAELVVEVSQPLGRDAFGGEHELAIFRGVPTG